MSDEFKEPVVDFDILNRADGSCRYTQGLYNSKFLIHKDEYSS